VRLSDTIKMDILPSGNIFRELQDIHDTGYFSAQPSLEDHWQQVFFLTFSQKYSS
jgi:krueppel-like factor 6/7